MDNNKLIERLLDKQDKIAQDIGDIKVNLEYHIKRTDLLEVLVQQNKDEHKEQFNKLEADVKPVKDHVQMMLMVGKIVAKVVLILVGIVSFATGVIKLVQHLS